MRRSSPFFIFVSIVGLLIAGAIIFIQSPQFASLVKQVLAKNIRGDVGIEGDFSELEVGLFPPGLSMRNPRVKLKERNIAGLPPGSEISAERIDFVFKPVQMFSGNIRVNEVSIVNGDVKLLLKIPDASKKAKKGFKPDFHWDELFQVHAEAVSVKNTRFHIETAPRAGSRPFKADFMAESLRLGQWSGKGGLGYQFDIALNAVKLDLGQDDKDKQLTIPSSMDRLIARARINASAFNIDALEFSSPGVELIAQGGIQGNLLETKGLMFEGEATIKTQVARVIEVMFLDPKRRPAMDGAITFSGKVKTDPQRALDTLHIQGKIDGKDLRFEKWATDSASADLEWKATSRTEGELSVSKAVIQSREIQRKAGNQPGSGGRIEIGAFTFNPALPTLKLPLSLSRVHIHWLAAPGLKKVYPLDLRASGQIDAEIQLPTAKRSWVVDAKAALEVEDFQLDNQKLGEKKPLSKVIQVPKLQVETGIHADSTGLELEDTVVSTGGESKFQGGGRIDFKAGYDLVFDGPVNLSEIGQIAENDIRGTGSLECRVHGPMSSVQLDFDTQLKNASYLQLAFGDLSGRISWDDGKDQLHFTRVSALKGKTSYLGKGMIDLAKGVDTVDIGVKITHGDIRDLSQVFAHLTRDMWWYPRDLVGATYGDVHVSGGLGLDKLTVTAQLSGSDWEYLGERFSSVSLQGGYDKGKYEVADFKALKRTGRLYGRISLDAARNFDWGFHSENLIIGDSDHFAQLDVPMKGAISIESSGQGPEGSIKSSSQFNVTDFVVRGRAMPPSHLTIKTEGGRADIQGSALGGQGTLEARYGFTPGMASSIKAEVKHLDFSPMLLLINPKMMQDRNLAGFISGQVNLAFKSGAIDRASGKMELSEYLLAKTGTRFALSHPVEVSIEDGSFDLPDASLKGNEGEATLTLSGRKAELEGSITGDIDVSVAEFFTSSVSKAEGTGTLDFILGGAIKEPSVFGRVTLEGASLRVPSVESPFENISGTLQLKQNTISVQNLTADLAGGRVEADGSIVLYADRAPAISLKATLGGSKIKVYPFQFVKVRGDVDIHGEKIPYQIDGSLAIDSALSKEKVFQKKGETLKALQYTPPPTSRRASDIPLFKLNINAVAERGVLIQNDLFDAEAKGRFTLVNTLEAPRVIGTAEIIAGKLLFKDRTFQIQSANANFDNPTVINPSFTLVSTTEVGGTKIQMYVTGRMDALKVELTSNPVLPESEILTLLALGVSSSDAKKLSATDRSVFEQGEAASLLLHSLDFNREVQSKTGLQIQLDESIAPQLQGTSIFKPLNQSDSVAAPKIVIKRQIGKRIDLSYGTTVGSATANSQRQVNAEYHVKPGFFSVLGVWDTYETIDTKERTSLGLDLKFQTRFK